MGILTSIFITEYVNCPSTIPRYAGMVCAFQNHAGFDEIGSSGEVLSSA